MTAGPKKPEYEPRSDTQRLAYLFEECGEVLVPLSVQIGKVLAAGGKTLRWGLQSSNPEVPPEERETNAAWLFREVEDLQAAIDRAMPMLVEAAAPRCGDVSKAKRGVPDGRVCNRRIGHADRGSEFHTDGAAMWSDAPVVGLKDGSR